MPFRADGLRFSLKRSLNASPWHLALSCELLESVRFQRFKSAPRTAGQIHIVPHQLFHTSGVEPGSIAPGGQRWMPAAPKLAHRTHEDPWCPGELTDSTLNAPSVLSPNWIGTQISDRISRTVTPSPVEDQDSIGDVCNSRATYHDLMVSTSLLIPLQIVWPVNARTTPETVVTRTGPTLTFRSVGLPSFPNLTSYSKALC